MTNNVWASFPDTDEASSRTKCVFQRFPYKWFVYTVFGQWSLSQAEDAMETKKCANVNLCGALSQYSTSEKYPTDDKNAAVHNGVGLEML